VDLLLQIGLGNAVLATLLALLAAGLGRVLRRPALTHGLWLLVLIKLITPSLWPVQVWPSDPEPATATAEIALVPSSQTGQVPEAELPPTTPEDSRELAVEAGGPTPPSPADHFPGAAAPAAPGVSWKSVAAGVWLAGTALWFLVCAGRVYRFRRLLRHARPAPAELQDDVRRLAQQMGLRRFPDAWMVPGAVSPMLWALGGRPRLLIPAALVERISAVQRATILAHELAHLCRGDHWVRRLELVTTGLYWWHPVLWWARREIGIAEEECCDAWVVGELPAAARDYARALVETMDFLSEVRPALPPAASGVGHVHLLRRRLTMIMLGTTPKRLSGAGLLALLGLGAVALPVVPIWGQEPHKEIKVQVVTPDGTAPDGQRRVILVDPGDETGTKTVERVQVIRREDRKSDGSVEEARDDVELLEVQLEVKRAELAESEARIKQAQRDLERVGRLKVGSAVSQGELDAAKDKFEIAQAQLQQKRAQLKEAEVRLVQAKRRLTRLQGAKEPARNPAPARPPAVKEPVRGTLRVVPSEGASKEEVRRVQELEEKLRATMEKLMQAESVQKKLQAERAAAMAAAEQAKAAVGKAAKGQIEKAKTERDFTNKFRDAKGAKDNEGARLKALEDRLDALTREMEALRKDLKELVPRTLQPRRPGQRAEPPRSEAVPRDNEFLVAPKDKPLVPYKVVPAPTPYPDRDPRSTPTVPLKPPAATDQTPR
jgi:beta-lactamase regulating signal transducer with metallopeptidase domain